MQNGLDPEIQATIAALSQPEAVPTLPAEPKSKLWQRILTSIADAGMAYAGRPGNYTSGLLNRDELINREIIGNENLQAGAKNKASRTANELKLQALLRKQDREDRQAEARGIREEVKVIKDEEKTAKAVEAAQKEAIRLEDIKREDTRLAADRKHDIVLARIHSRSSAGDKAAEKQLETLAEAKGAANQIANMAKQMVEGYVETDEKGRQIEHQPMPKAEIRKRYIRDLKALNMTPEAREAAIAYYDAEVEPEMPRDEAPIAPGAGY